MGKIVSISKLCRGCMNSLNNVVGACPICGFDKEWYNTQRNKLRLDFILASRYMIGRVIAEDDYEITYIGWDLTADRRVLVKEYYPKKIAARDRFDEGNVSIMDQNDYEQFYEGVKLYLKVSKELINIRQHDGMVKVMDIFEANNTIYQIISCPKGSTIADVIRQCCGQMPIGDIVDIIKVIARNLCIMHGRALICNAVSVNSILITEDAKIAMIGFSTVSNFLNLENIGTWTDVYDVCVTMYKMITSQFLGREENIRLEERNIQYVDIVKPSFFGIDIPVKLENILMKGLRQDYMTMENFYKELCAVDQFESNISNNKIDLGINRQLDVSLVQTQTKKNGLNYNQLEGRQFVMEDNMNKRMGMTSSDKYMNEQSKISNMGKNVQPNVNVVNVNGQARLNSALRAKRFGETQSINVSSAYTKYANADDVKTLSNTQTLNNVQNLSNTQTLYNVQNNGNTQRNNMYPIQDDWSEQASQRVQSYSTQQLQNNMNTMQNRQMNQNQNYAQNYSQNQGYSQNRNIRQQPTHNDMQKQTARQENRGPQRPELPQVGTMYPVPYVNPEIGVRRNAIRTNVIEKESSMMSAPSELRQRSTKIQYDNMPLYYEDNKKKKVNKGTFASIAVCFALIGLAAIMFGSTLKNKGKDSQADNNLQTIQPTNEQGQNVPGTQVQRPDGSFFNNEKVMISSEPVKEYLISKKFSVDDDTLMTGDLKNITKLEFDGEKFTTLLDFIYFPSLQSLTLSNCNIDNDVLKTLKGLEKLEIIDLTGNNKITDFSSLSTIKTLKRIVATGTKITDKQVEYLEKNSEVDLLVEK